MADIDKWDYVQRMSERYHGKCRNVKRHILDEMEEMLDIHRGSCELARYLEYKLLEYFKYQKFRYY